MRELRFPLTRTVPLPHVLGGAAAEWAAAVRNAWQPCLLVDADGAVVAVSPSSVALLDGAPKPGWPIVGWWREAAVEGVPGPAPVPAPARALAAGAPLHTVARLSLPSGRDLALQVVCVPITRTAAGTTGVLVWVWPL